ncbi:MAG: c-type cytochrome [Magnetovibrio sp.]|nr:c-type cytochrome [Magnetovibrio sp.]
MNTSKLLALGIAAAIAVSSSSAMAASKGAKLFKKKCGTCHSMEVGKHKIGPSLAGIIGRKAGSTDFKKYKALKGSEIVWDEKSLDAWITNPKKFIGKPTAMTVKVKKEKDRKLIIGFLKGE